jgi:lipopolysaccharide transport system permease protein
MITKNESWLFEITPKNNLFSLNLKEVWNYRDLLMLFVRRDVVTVYKQTVLGPLWYLIEPLFTAVVFTLIFNNVANISTGEIPPFLFNLAGITIWNYFKTCLTNTSSTFNANANIFGKVYFPRMVIPISVVISNLFRFGIQMLIFIVFYIYYYFNGANISLNSYAFLFPIMIIIMGLLGLGMGMFLSSLISKYRDFRVLISFGIQLLMYLSAVMYPISFFKEKMPDYVWLVEYNPLAFVIEQVRYMLLNTTTTKFNVVMFIYVMLFTVVILILGALVFNKAEKNFIDTV